MGIDRHTTTGVTSRVMHEDTRTRTRAMTSRRSIVVRQHRSLSIQRTSIISQTLIVRRRQVRTILTPPVVITLARILNPPRTRANRAVAQLGTRITHTKSRNHPESTGRGGSSTLPTPRRPRCHRTTQGRKAVVMPGSIDGSSFHSSMTDVRNCFEGHDRRSTGSRCVNDQMIPVIPQGGSSGSSLIVA
ncbi:hypothetical protein HMPREF1301_00839 [Propionibacterium sp. KPL2005]|nr:hypothetical protein HMPREF1301_00839 [Propionibacterium sp. KPL2005]ERS29726.1 hypothetical protein HMPREF1297_00547 [Propionibacterium sp. KPL2000]